MQGEKQRGNSVSVLNCDVTWNNVCRLSSIPRKKFLKTSHINPFFFASTCFSLKRFFSYIHDSTMSVFSSPFTSLSVFDVLHNPAFGHTVFSETDERKWFIHQTRPGIQIPADLLIRWLILQIFLRAGARLPTLIRALRQSMVHGSSCLLQWLPVQQTQTGLTSENDHIASPNSNVKPYEGLQGWLHDTRVRQNTVRALLSIY